MAIQLMELKEPEAWHQDVDLIDLLDTIYSELCRYIVFKDDNSALACTLWILATWFVEELDFVPYMLITAPEKGCGKSQLLKLMSRLSRKPLNSSNLTQATVYRIIDKCKPTLFIDEVDTFIGNNKELIGVLNCGNERDSSYVYRNEKSSKGELIPTAYDCFGFKALSGINSKSLASALVSRSIVIELRKKLKDEKVEKLRSGPKPDFDEICQKCVTIRNKYRGCFKSALTNVRNSLLPSSLNDREKDKWEPLIALISLTGNRTALTMVQECSIALSQLSCESSKGTSIHLLEQLKELFNNNFRDYTKISSEALVNVLLSNEESEWQEANNGRRINQKWLAHKLGIYGIKSTQFKAGGVTKRGYIKDDFEEVFKRYLD